MTQLTISFCLSVDLPILFHKVGFIVILVLANGCRVRAGWSLWTAIRLTPLSPSTLPLLLSFLHLITNQTTMTSILLILPYWL